MPEDAVAALAPLPLAEISTQAAHLETAPVPEEAVAATESQPLSEISAVFDSLNINARRAKRTGHFYLSITLCIGASILLLFVYSSEFLSVIIPEELPRSYSPFGPSLVEQFKDALGPLKDTIDAINRAAGNDQTIQKELYSVMEARIKPPTRGPVSPFSSVLSSLTGSVVRIGAVVIGIFLIQIMVGFARYYYRLAEHLRTCAISVKLSGGRLPYLQTLIPLFVPSTIDFAKVPHSPIEKIVDTALKTVEEVSKKIPTR